MVVNLVDKMVVLMVLWLVELTAGYLDYLLVERKDDLLVALKVVTLVALMVVMMVVRLVELTAGYLDYLLVERKDDLLVF